MPLRWKKFLMLIGANIGLIYLVHFPRSQIPTTNLSDLSVDQLEETLLLENTCKLPIIEPNEPNLNGYIQQFRSIQCNSQMPNIVSMDEEFLILHNPLGIWERAARVPSHK
ncbi:unnamed protein product [Thelazia callipaeda]|uniref:Uncharacterized protein n=1 Tax=Thelazia callipaeda TaxID=103827 RepID=A0A0N5D989_THECL|nr:unnamed protein product [Thelazia callipaeda]